MFRPKHLIIRATLFLCLLAWVTLAAGELQSIGEETKPVAKGQWDVAITLPRPPRKGKPQKPSVAHLWLPKTKEKIRGLILAINGEFEDCGPAGGDIGRGLRAAYSLHPSNKKKRNQSQWILIRMQMMARRRKNPDNLMSLVVHRESGHVSWNADMTALTAQFIRSAADARIPKAEPDGKTAIPCRPLKAKDGWLSDADIKAPKFKPAPHGEYKGDKALAFWHVDEAMARAVAKYHGRSWKDADPTAALPAKKRYTPPPMLRDTIDSKEAR